MNLCHFLQVPFTGLGLKGGYRGDAWLKNRLKVFKEYVVPSLLNQTDTNWTLWCTWRSEERENPIVQEFINNLDSVAGLSTIHSFGGVMFWDDKYSGEEASQRLKESLKINLKQVKHWVMDEHDYVLCTIQPSDDLYISSAIADIRKKFEELLPSDKIHSVGFRKGYIMNYNTRELAEYNPDTIPPFFTIALPRKVFLDPEAHYKAIGPYQSHEYITKHIKFTALDGRGFIVGTHGANISTNWSVPYKGKIIEGEERDDLLWRFGVFFSGPVILPKSWRIRLREVYNRLPLREVIRSIYKKLPNRMQKL